MDVVVPIGFEVKAPEVLPNAEKPRSDSVGSQGRQSFSFKGRPAPQRLPSSQRMAEICCPTFAVIGTVAAVAGIVGICYFGPSFFSAFKADPRPDDFKFLRLMTGLSFAALWGCGVTAAATGVYSCASGYCQACCERV